MARRLEELPHAGRGGRQVRGLPFQRHAGERKTTHVLLLYHPFRLDYCVVT